MGMEAGRSCTGGAGREDPFLRSARGMSRKARFVTPAGLWAKILLFTCGECSDGFAKSLFRLPDRCAHLELCTGGVLVGDDIALWKLSPRKTRVVKNKMDTACASREQVVF